MIFYQFAPFLSRAFCLEGLQKSFDHFFYGKGFGQTEEITLCLKMIILPIIGYFQEFIILGENILCSEEFLFDVKIPK